MRRVLVLCLLLAMVPLMLTSVVEAAPLVDPPVGTIDLNSLWGLAGVPVVMAMVGAVKRVWPTLEERWYPLVSIVCGLALNLFLAWVLTNDYRVAIVLGIVTGLAASGLYSGTKAIQGI